MVSGPARPAGGNSLRLFSQWAHTADTAGLVEHATHVSILLLCLHNLHGQPDLFHGLPSLSLRGGSGGRRGVCSPDPDDFAAHLYLVGKESVRPSSLEEFPKR